ncbi:4Fe-4S dicluster domain-containing protein [Blattabacterium sp. (Cryptocercus punctulatus) str. Cpu]|uniref:4Fe-4S dicluster domain-containing protein n=1 Tax=Blattabacterium sp. (Cryptocercus punctulatus) str. Cpu TaxID=1075399 RepID=UPI00023871CA|nr:4Fe-4S dicluster domain-containing protein [Blattabacterium sp. (Cryptocercus punctulatus) str. Cpu]AEU09577.1 molybdopterin oxidoreductase iron-sulfur binding subunit [Blattabacterium sp. (Cryptocercus punctulatus) str. Cpu]
MMESNNKKKSMGSSHFEKNTLVQVFVKKNKTSRRDFLKWIGFSTASVTLAACKGPVIKSIPYIVKPDSITPGIPTYYASTMMDSFDIGSVLVKTREGRPIKIEPNLTSKYFNTTSVRIQSSLLSLYDEERLKNPFINGNKCSWKVIDNYVITHLKKISKIKKDIVIFSSSYPSYSTKKLIQDFTNTYPTTKWITYDAISYSVALDASEKIFGIRGFPLFDLSKTELIVSFDADFLGDWSPENLAKSYVNNKIPKKSMLKHIQIESNMTLSGANADIRISRKPSEINKILFKIYQKIFLEKKINENEDEEINKIAYLILEKGSKSVIFADGNLESYILSFLINQKIKSNALQKNKFILSKESNDKKLQKFIIDLEKEKIGAILIHNTNPIYSLPFSSKIKKFFKKIPITISFSMKRDETNETMNVLAPIPHWLESWGDTHPLTGFYTLIQPTIQSLFNTRQFQESLIIWGKIPEKNYYEYLKKIWEKKIIPQSNVSSFNEALFHGVVEKKENIKTNKLTYDYQKKIHEYGVKLINNEKKGKKNLELRLYTKISIGDGNQHDNPWIQEFPDPITRTTWENYLTISSYDAKKIGLKNWYTGNGSMNGNCVNLIKNHKILIKNIPVYIQPGQGIGSIGLSFGYGQKIGKLSKICQGKNAYKVYENFSLIQKNIQIKKVNKIHKFACFQVQNTTVGRNLVKETDLETFLKKSKKIWNEEEKILTHKGMLPPEKISLWEDKNNKKEKNGHHFNLSIDLNACIGCGACVIACHTENNVPVVGKEEIRKSRDMHWLRIDRYYSKKINSSKNDKDFFKNPKVSFQPIMCQHCEYAPCETVCPVGATSHGMQGQNMMIYNRCVGTRYCANNCPYKVRRFNWFNYVNNQKFNYNMNNSLGKMVLNPDVVVRTRGVMEKCSLCIQKTQYVIGVAKKENRKIKNEEFETACSISCPTNAIVFGDINEKNSKILKKIRDKRNYKLLDFLGIRPNVSYQLKVKNLK